MNWSGASTGTESVYFVRAQGSGPRDQGWARDQGGYSTRMAWPSHRLQDLLGIDVPLVQAPMAGANGSAMAIAVSEAGGLGSLPAAMLSPEQLAAEITAIRAATSRPVNVNFFCHRQPDPDPALDEEWRARLA